MSTYKIISIKFSRERLFGLLYSLHGGCHNVLSASVQNCGIAAEWVVIFISIQLEDLIKITHVSCNDVDDSERVKC